MTIYMCIYFGIQALLSLIHQPTLDLELLDLISVKWYGNIFNS